MKKFTHNDRIVIDIHAFVYEGTLCWMSFLVDTYDQYRRVRDDYFKSAVVYGDYLVFISITDDLEDYTAEHIVKVIAKARRDANFKSIRLD